MIVDPPLGDIGELAPAAADVDPAPLEPVQQRGGVLDVEIEFRRLGADRPIVELEHAVVLAELEREQRRVPPQVLAERVAVVPCPVGLAEEGHALREPTLHLQHVGDRVHRPQIVLADLDCPPPLGLGRRIVPALLQAERVHPQHVAVARHPGVPGADRARHRVAHEVRLAGPEQREMLQPHREQVVRVLNQNVVPDADRARRVALAPGGERGNVLLLAWRGARRRAFGKLERGIDLGVDRVGAEQHE